VGNLDSTNVQNAIEELDNEKTTEAYVGEAIGVHEVAPVAHEASQISFSDTNLTSHDVKSAILEVSNQALIYSLIFN
jgi:hypothetical protein